MQSSQWLNEHYPGGPMDGMEYRVAMERYTNFRTTDLQAKIMGFRNKIKEEWLKLPYRYNEDFLKEYDEFFNIVKYTHGETK